MSPITTNIKSPTLDRTSTLYVVSHKSVNLDDDCLSPVYISKTESKKPLLPRKTLSFRQNPFVIKKTDAKQINAIVIEDKNELNVDLACDLKL